MKSVQSILLPLVESVPRQLDRQKSAFTIIEDNASLYIYNINLPNYKKLSKLEIVKSSQVDIVFYDEDPASLQLRDKLQNNCNSLDTFMGEVLALNKAVKINNIQIKGEFVQFELDDLSENTLIDFVGLLNTTEANYLFEFHIGDEWINITLKPTNLVMKEVDEMNTLVLADSVNKVYKPFYLQGGMMRGYAPKQHYIQIDLVYGDVVKKYLIQSKYTALIAQILYDPTALNSSATKELKYMGDRLYAVSSVHYLLHRWGAIDLKQYNAINSGAFQQKLLNKISWHCDLKIESGTHRNADLFEVIFIMFFQKFQNQALLKMIYANKININYQVGYLNRTEGQTYTIDDEEYYFQPIYGIYTKNMKDMPLSKWIHYSDQFRKAFPIGLHNYKGLAKNPNVINAIKKKKVELDDKTGYTTQRRDSAALRIAFKYNDKIYETRSSPANYDCCKIFSIMTYKACLKNIPVTYQLLEVLETIYQNGDYVDLLKAYLAKNQKYFSQAMIEPNIGFDITKHKELNFTKHDKPSIKIFTKVIFKNEMWNADNYSHMAVNTFPMVVPKSSEDNLYHFFVENEKSLEQDFIQDLEKYIFDDLHYYRHILGWREFDYTANEIQAVMTKFEIPIYFLEPMITNKGKVHSYKCFAEVDTSKKYLLVGVYDEKGVNTYKLINNKIQDFLYVDDKNEFFKQYKIRYQNNEEHIDYKAVTQNKNVPLQPIKQNNQVSKIQEEFKNRMNNMIRKPDYNQVHDLLSRCMAQVVQTEQEEHIIITKQDSQAYSIFDYRLEEIDGDYYELILNNFRSSNGLEYEEEFRDYLFEVAGLRDDIEVEFNVQPPTHYDKEEERKQIENTNLDIPPPLPVNYEDVISPEVRNLINSFYSAQEDQNMDEEESQVIGAHAKMMTKEEIEENKQRFENELEKIKQQKKIREKTPLILEEIISKDRNLDEEVISIQQEKTQLHYKLLSYDDEGKYIENKVNNNIKKLMSQTEFEEDRDKPEPDVKLDSLIEFFNQRKPFPEEPLNYIYTSKFDLYDLLSVDCDQVLSLLCTNTTNQIIDEELDFQIDFTHEQTRFTSPTQNLLDILIAYFNEGKYYLIGTQHTVIPFFRRQINKNVFIIYFKKQNVFRDESLEVNNVEFNFVLQYYRSLDNIEQYDDKKLMSQGFRLLEIKSKEAANAANYNNRAYTIYTALQRVKQLDDVLKNQKLDRQLDKYEQYIKAHKYPSHKWWNKYIYTAGVGLISFALFKKHKFEAGMISIGLLGYKLYDYWNKDKPQVYIPVNQKFYGMQQLNKWLPSGNLFGNQVEEVFNEIKVESTNNNKGIIAKMKFLYKNKMEMKTNYRQSSHYQMYNRSINIVHTEDVDLYANSRQPCNKIICKKPIKKILYEMIQQIGYNNNVKYLHNFGVASYATSANSLKSLYEALFLRHDAVIVKPDMSYIRRLREQSKIFSVQLNNYIRANIHYKTFNELIQESAPEKKRRYKLYRYQTIKDMKMRHSLQPFVKYDEYYNAYFHPDKAEYCKPRMIWNPSNRLVWDVIYNKYCIEGLIGFINSENEFNQDFKNIRVAIGLNGQQLHDLISSGINKVRSAKHDVMFLMADGSNFDSCQNTQVLQNVDHVIHSQIFDTIYPKMNMPIFLRDEYKASLFKAKRSFVLKYREQYITHGLLDGTVTSGDTVMTTFGNTIRQGLYVDSVYKKNKIKNYMIFVAGDDLLILCQKNQVNRCKEALCEIGANDNIDTNKGYGQILKMVNCSDRQFEFLSKYGYYEPQSNSLVIERQLDRIKQTGDITNSITKGNLTVDEYRQAIQVSQYVNYHGNNYLRNILPNFQQIKYISNSMILLNKLNMYKYIYKAKQTNVLEQINFYSQYRCQIPLQPSEQLLKQITERFQQNLNNENTLYKGLQQHNIFNQQKQYLMNDDKKLSKNQQRKQRKLKARSDFNQAMDNLHEQLVKHKTNDPQSIGEQFNKIKQLANIKQPVQKGNVYDRNLDGRIAQKFLNAEAKKYSIMGDQDKQKLKILLAADDFSTLFNSVAPLVLKHGPTAIEYIGKLLTKKSMSDKTPMIYAPTLCQALQPLAPGGLASVGGQMASHANYQYTVGLSTGADGNVLFNLPVASSCMLSTPLQVKDWNPENGNTQNLTGYDPGSIADYSKISAIRVKGVKVKLTTVSSTINNQGSLYIGYAPGGVIYTTGSSKITSCAKQEELSQLMYNKTYSIKEDGIEFSTPILSQNDFSSGDNSFIAYNYIAPGQTNYDTYHTKNASSIYIAISGAQANTTLFNVEIQLAYDIIFNKEMFPFVTRSTPAPSIYTANAVASLYQMAPYLCHLSEYKRQQLCNKFSSVKTIEALTNIIQNFD